MRQPTAMRLALSGLDRLPRVPEVPEGYLLRTWRDGDEVAIPALLGEAFGPSRASFHDLQQFWLTHPGIRPEGIFIIESEVGEVAGTATARIDEVQDHAGYVHRVAVRRTHRRRGLATLVVLKALHHIADHHGRPALVETNEDNMLAISLYLKLGFEPAIEDEQTSAQWQEIRSVLSQRVHATPDRRLEQIDLSLLRFLNCHSQSQTRNRLL